MATLTPSEENVYMAKLSEQAERYEEMVTFIEKVSDSIADSDEVTVKERNLLSEVEEVEEKYKKPLGKDNFHKTADDG